MPRTGMPPAYKLTIIVQAARTDAVPLRYPL